MLIYFTAAPLGGGGSYRHSGQHGAAAGTSLGAIASLDTEIFPRVGSVGSGATFAGAFEHGLSA